MRGLKSGVPVVVGTPGRLIDHLERGTLKLEDVRTVVLDEADEMISMGFRESIEMILARVPKETSRTWLFSATMSSGVRHVAEDFLREPKLVQVNRGEMLSANVEQLYYMTHEKNKPEILGKLIDSAEDFYGLVFCQTKTLVVDLVRYLTERGYKVDALHGDMTQASREAAMLGFRSRRTRVLVCTDVASRGLDVKDVTHVVNYSLPRELENYVHRIGRTARSGKSGVARSLVTPSHRHLLAKIERMTKSRFKEGVVPTRKEIGLKKIAALLSQFQEISNHERALELMDASWKEAVASMNSDEVAARFLAMMFPFVFAEKKQAPMQTAQPPVEKHDSKAERRQEKRRDKRDRRKRFSKGYQKRMGGDAPPRRRPGN